jgi:hypothetical protein
MPTHVASCRRLLVLSSAALPTRLRSVFELHTAVAAAAGGVGAVEVVAVAVAATATAAAAAAVAAPASSPAAPPAAPAAAVLARRLERFALADARCSNPNEVRREV